MMNSYIFMLWDLTSHHKIMHTYVAYDQAMGELVTFHQLHPSIGHPFIINLIFEVT